MKHTILILALASSAVLISCADVAAPDVATLQASAVKTQPTLIKLNNPASAQREVKLRWATDVPSMDMTNTDPGSGWAVGNKDSDGVYSFAQEKFYGLTLDFNKKTFIETGFDGAWLPEVKGTWTAIR